MKKCNKCGIVQKNDRNTCVECGSILGKPFSKDAEEQNKDEISVYDSDISILIDDFYVSTWDKVMGGLCVLGILLSLILPQTQPNFSGDIFYAIGLLFLLNCLIMCIFPRFIWFLHKLRFIFFNIYDDLSPSEFYFIFIKIIRYISFAIGFYFIFSLINNFIL